MNIRELHPWTVTTAEAREIQQQLAAKVRGAGAPRRVRYVAGVDLAFADDLGIAAVVVLRWPQLELVEQVTHIAPTPMPYIPGLLSFRELPVLLPAFSRLQHRPDLVFVDGQGQLHPRRFGVACHLGLMLGLPTIGCAKSWLCGEYREPAPSKGADEPVRMAGRIVGRALRTRDRTRVIFVSVGHAISLRKAVEWTMAVSPKYRIPEPTRQADMAAAVAKKTYLAKAAR